MDDPFSDDQIQNFCATCSKLAGLHLYDRTAGVYNFPRHYVTQEPRAEYLIVNIPKLQDILDADVARFSVLLHETQQSFNALSALVQRIELIQRLNKVTQENKLLTERCSALTQFEEKSKDSKDSKEIKQLPSTQQNKARAQFPGSHANFFTPSTDYFQCSREPIDLGQYIAGITTLPGTDHFVVVNCNNVTQHVISVYNQSFKLLKTLHCPEMCLSLLAPVAVHGLPNYRLALVKSGNTSFERNEKIDIFDLSTQDNNGNAKLICSFTCPGNQTHVTVLADGRIIAKPPHHKMVSIFDPDRQKSQLFDIGVGRCIPVDLSNGRVAFGGNEGLVILNIKNGQLTSMSNRKTITGIAYLNNLSLLAAVSATSGCLSMWHISDNSLSKWGNDRILPHKGSTLLYNYPPVSLLGLPSGQIVSYAPIQEDKHINILNILEEGPRPQKQNLLTCDNLVWLGNGYMIAYIRSMVDDKSRVQVLYSPNEHNYESLQKSLLEHLPKQPALCDKIIQYSM